MSRRNLGGLAVLLAGAAFLAAVIVYRFFPFWGDLGLRGAPDVARVEVPIRLWSPRRTIVHVCDWHLVPREMHEGPEPYERHLEDVEHVQGEQRDLLRHLVERFGLQDVYLEGLTADTVQAYRDKVAGLGPMERHGIQTLLDQLAEAQALKAEGARQLEKEILATLAEHRERVLSVGAPGRLVIGGGWVKVLPLDDAGPLAAADPRKADAATLKAREDAIVRNALKGGEPVVVIVLGAGHDLTESVRAADPDCGYVRVVTKKVAELVSSR